MPDSLETTNSMRRFTLKLRDDVEIHDTVELAIMVMVETNASVAQKQPLPPEVESDFQISCDSLNANRVDMRLLEEEWSEEQRNAVLGAMIEYICAKRGYDVDDFRAGMAATRKRARFPFGVRPLTMALERAMMNPICLKDPRLVKAKTAQQIASLAYHLQQIVGDNPIMLPVNSVRKLFSLRKVVVSGTIQLLMLSGVLECTDPNYHTGRARHFRFVGLRGVHYEMEKGTSRTEEEIPF